MMTHINDLYLVINGKININVRNFDDLKTITVMTPLDAMIYIKETIDNNIDKCILEGIDGYSKIITVLQGWSQCLSLVNVSNKERNNVKTIIDSTISWITLNRIGLQNTEVSTKPFLKSKKPKQNTTEIVSNSNTKPLTIKQLSVVLEIEVNNNETNDCQQKKKLSKQEQQRLISKKANKQRNKQISDRQEFYRKNGMIL